MDIELDPIPEDVVWIVYTPNAGGAEQAEDAETYPFLAHYVKADGTYLCNLPVREPGDEEAIFGYRKQDVFSGMTADTYTGEITDMNGNARTVTVPVMRSEADGCWYLGDVNRRIAVANYFEAAYGENHDIVLIKSEDNASWDKEDVGFFYNYLRAYDFYADMGWIGPDGEGTDEVILSGMCYSNGMIFDNACSMGKMECWQCFSYAPYNGAGNPTGYGSALDILAHEYTHTFTATVMNQNLYENDPGAINEAMSDIMGNLVEYICKDTEDTTWHESCLYIEILPSTHIHFAKRTSILFFSRVGTCQRIFTVTGTCRGWVKLLILISRFCAHRFQLTLPFVHHMISSRKHIVQLTVIRL